jgi:oligopeptide/dipeptide ABC transporter ATP-binding protein
MHLLEVERVEVTVHTGGRILKALDGISFSVDAGEVLGIVGESGSGKSMTALAILRLLPSVCRVSGGTVRFDGKNLLDLSSEEMRQIRGAKLSVIFQDPLSALNPVFTVGNQVGEALRVHQGLGRAATRTRVLDLLDIVGLPDPAHRIDQYPHELSGGMRQRVAIAMALACQPKLLIADEPTTALDVTVQAQILRLLRRLQRQFGMAIIFISHDLGVIAQFADRLAVMYAGQIVEQGPVRDVLDRPSHPYTQALLQSIPALTPDGERLPMIRGTVPALSELPSGCHFRVRCDYERPPCATMPCGFITTVPPSQLSACIRHTGYRYDVI